MIETEAEYDAALKELERYFDTEPAPGTVEADRFNTLVAMVVAYEDRHYPVPSAEPS